MIPSPQHEWTVSDSSTVVLGLGLSFSLEELAVEHFNAESIRQLADQVDCTDPRAQRCYRLLYQALRPYPSLAVRKCHLLAAN